MKPFTHALAAATLLLVAACHRRTIEPADITYSPPPPITDPAVLRAPAELRTALRDECERRQQAEAQLIKEKTSKSHWQAASMLCLAFAIAMLVVGAIAGSQASKESDDEAKS